MPEILANLVKRPTNKPKPININPQIFKKSVTSKIFGLEIIQWKNPEKSHFESIK